MSRNGNDEAGDATSGGAAGSTGDGENALAQILGPAPPPIMVKHPGQQEIKPLPKRFYKDATVGEAPIAVPAATPGISLCVGGYPVLLDGRGAKTPRRKALVLPTEGLAGAVAAEWQAQLSVINPVLMPLTRLANTALDGVMGREADVRADIVKYAGSDLLCYRAESPAALTRRQAEHWDSVLAWANGRLGAVFQTGSGLMPVRQPPGIATALAVALEPLDAFRLTSLHVMTTLTGSAVLALAVLEGELAAKAAWLAAHVDEDWQIERWGADGEAEIRRARRWTEMTAAARMLELLGAD